LCVFLIATNKIALNPSHPVLEMEDNVSSFLQVDKGGAAEQ
jgi:hypothetical protein